MNQRTAHNAASILLSIFSHSGAGRPVTLGSLASEHGLSLEETHGVLEQLRSRGLVQNARFALTLQGLAVSASLRRVPASMAA